MLPIFKRLGRRRRIHPLAYPLVLGLCLCSSPGLQHANAAPPQADPDTSAAANRADALHVRIDQLIAQHALGVPSPRASDTTLIRRLTLDLHGTIPTADSVRQFRADTSPDRYKQLVQQLLEHPRFARHMAIVFDVALMERRPASQVDANSWHQYLFEAFRQNRPYHELVAEMMESDGTQPDSRTAARFFLDRAVEPNLLTRDLGRVFFGRDLQCAQCHDHPIVTRYRQHDYYSLYAFVNRSYAFADPKLKKNVLAEKAEGDANFQSVFTGEDERVNPQLPGAGEFFDPTLEIGTEYQVKPAKNVRPIPTYSRRLQLAAGIRAGNRVFARTLANRLWAQLFGRGLVDPVDLDHPENPAAHPAVLELLTDEILSTDFNVRHLVRQIVLTEAYQRSSESSSLQPPSADKLAAQLAELESASERLQQHASTLEAQFNQAAAARVAAWDAYKPVADKGNAPVAALTKTVAALQAAQSKLAAAEQLVKTRTAARVSIDDAITAVNSAATTLSAEDDQLTKIIDSLKAQQTRLKKLETEATAARDKSKAESEQLAATRKTQQQAVEKWRTELAPLDDTYRTARAEYDPINAKLKSAEADWHLAEYRVQAAHRLLELRQAIDQLAAPEKLVAEAAREVQAFQPRLQQLESMLSQSAQQLESAQQQLRSAQAKQQSADSHVAQVQTAIQSVHTALKSLERQPAAQSKPAQSHLQQALKTLTSSHEAARQAAIAAASQLKLQQTALATATKHHQAAQNQLTQFQAEMRPAVERHQAARQKLAEMQQTVAQLQEDCFEDARKQALTATLKPLTPEQLAWSLMQATGLAENQRAASLAALQKADAEAAKKEAAAKNDAAAKKEAAASETDKQPAGATKPLTDRLEQAVYDKLKGTEKEFVALYAAGAGQPQQDFFATVDQALFVANGSRLLGWLNPSGNNLLNRLLKLESSSDVAEEMYLSILSRLPTEAEAAEVDRYLQVAADQRRTRLQEIAWALLSSVEFRFNY